MNQVTILGNLTRDPETRYSASGTAVGNFTVAVNRRWKTPSGESQEEVSFIDVTAFGNQAEVIAKYFTKGKRILVWGRLKQDSWDDKKTGVKRRKTGVVMEGFDFIDKAESDQAPARTRLAPTQQPLSKDESDDMPF